MKTGRVLLAAGCAAALGLGLTGCGGAGDTVAAKPGEDSRPKEVRESDDVMAKALQQYNKKGGRRR